MGIAADCPRHAAPQARSSRFPALTPRHRRLPRTAPLVNQVYLTNPQLSSFRASADESLTLASLE